MKVILTEYVYKHGVAGEVVNVADGYARNYLIPKKMAIPATAINLKNMENLRAQADTNRAEMNDRVSAIARQIDGVELVFGMKAGNNNKLYGSITSQMIKDALQTKTGIDINRRRISERPIRELGRYDIAVRMGEISPTLKVVVMREEEATAYLAGQNAPAEATTEAAPEATPETAPENVAAEATPANAPTSD